jgi:hypothetical protein
LIVEGVNRLLRIVVETNTHLIVTSSPCCSLVHEVVTLTLVVPIHAPGCLIGHPSAKGLRVLLLPNLEGIFVVRLSSDDARRKLGLPLESHLVKSIVLVASALEEFLLRNVFV